VLPAARCARGGGGGSSAVGGARARVARARDGMRRPAEVVCAKKRAGPYGPNRQNGLRTDCLLPAMADAAPPPRRFAVIDCEDAPKWRGHHQIWVAVYGRAGERWCGPDASPPLRPAHARRDNYRAWAGELPALAELPAYAGMVVTGRRAEQPRSRARARSPRTRSHHDAWDESLPWVSTLCAFLRARTHVTAPRAAHSAQEAVKLGGVKLLGGCFGCQVCRARAAGVAALTRTGVGPSAGRPRGPQPVGPLRGWLRAAGADQGAGVAARLRPRSGARAAPRPPRLTRRRRSAP